MRKSTRAASWLVGGIAAMSLSVAPAMGAVNIKSEPEITFDGDSATISGGNFSGLGNEPLYGTLEVEGVAYYECHNNGNPDNIVPGQNPVDAQVGTSGPVELPTTKNGRATVPDITASIEAETPTAAAVGCGGKGAVNNWTVELTSLEVTSATFTVTQDDDILYVWDYTEGGSSTGTLR